MTKMKVSYRLLISVYFSIILPIVSCAIPGIITTTDKDFETVAFGKPGKISIVNFYSNDCSHCQALKPHWYPLGDLYNGTDLQIVQINARENKRVRSQYQIIGFPTIKLFSSDGEEIASFTKHRGDRNIENLIKFIKDYTNIEPGNDIVKAVHLTEAENFISELDASLAQGQERIFILFRSSLSVLDNSIFPNKYNNYFEHFARKYHDSTTHQIKFFVVDTSIPELAPLSTLFQIDKSPTIMYKARDGNSSTWYKLIDTLAEPQNIAAIIEQSDDAILKQAIPFAVEKYNTEEAELELEPETELDDVAYLREEL